MGTSWRLRHISPIYHHFSPTPRLFQEPKRTSHWSKRVSIALSLGEREKRRKREGPPTPRLFQEPKSTSHWSKRVSIEHLGEREKRSRETNGNAPERTPQCRDHGARF